jgi:hypothetical protein
MQGEADVSAWVAKRVDMLLQQTARLGLRSRAACISYLGTSFCTPLQLSETKSDYAVSPPHHNLEPCLFSIFCVVERQLFKHHHTTLLNCVFSLSSVWF